MTAYGEMCRMLHAKMASKVADSMGAGHGLADASSASGGRTFAMPLVYATIEAKTGARSPYAGDSGPALPPANSVGCHTTCGNSAARCAACWPVPEATSKRLAGLLPANGSYLASTAAMGALLRSAEGAHCIFDSQAGSQVNNTRRSAAGERIFGRWGRHSWPLGDCTLGSATRALCWLSN